MIVFRFLRGGRRRRGRAIGRDNFILHFDRDNFILQFDRSSHKDGNDRGDKRVRDHKFGGGNGGKEGHVDEVGEDEIAFRSRFLGR